MPRHAPIPESSYDSKPFSQNPANPLLLGAKLFSQGALFS